MLVLSRLAIECFHPRVHEISLHKWWDFRLLSSPLSRQRRSIRVGYRFGRIFQSLTGIDDFHILAAAREEKARETNPDKRTYFHKSTAFESRPAFFEKRRYTFQKIFAIKTFELGLGFTRESTFKI